MDEVILKLEQSRENVILICDRAILRVLLAYFQARAAALLPCQAPPPGAISISSLPCRRLPNCTHLVAPILHHPLCDALLIDRICRGASERSCPTSMFRQAFWNFAGGAWLPY